jgi:DNA-binding NarL/FixJ family response regulator
MYDVVVAAANALMRRGVVSVLEGERDLRVMAEVGSPADVMSAVARHEPDVLVLDAGMRKEDDTLLPALRQEFSGTAILILVDHSYDDCLVRHFLEGTDGVRLSDEAADRLQDCCVSALRGSARGCVPKSAAPDDLVRAIRTILGGEIAAGPWIEALLGQAGSPHGAHVEALPQISGREFEVIELVAMGHSNKRIAKRLGLSEQTVKNHLTHVMQKLQVDSRLELALYALRRRLVPLAVKSDEA